MTLGLIALFFLAGGTAVIGLTRKPRSPGR